MHPVSGGCEARHFHDLARQANRKIAYRQADKKVRLGHLQHSLLTLTTAV
jgi:hypothetical protein